MIDKIRVLIIDEHPAVCQALSNRLNAAPTVVVVGSEPDFVDGLTAARALRPDVILLELKNLREGNGEPRESDAKTIISRLLECCTSAVIVLTSYPDEQERSGALNAGACRYLLKDIDTVRLVAEIEAVALEARAALPPTSPRLRSQNEDEQPRA